MRPALPLRLIASLITSLVASACQVDKLPPGMHVTAAWSRPTPPNATVGVVYLSIKNATGKADALLEASTPRAADVAMHATQIQGGVSSMQHRNKVELPAGSEVKFEPGGLHFMLMGLQQPLLQDEVIPFTLKFEKSAAQTIEVRVRAVE